MNFLDIIIGLFLGWGLYKGIKSGLLLELASLAALVVGIYAAIHFSYIVGDYIMEKWQWNESTINIIACILTFIIVVLIINLIGKVLTKVANVAMLGGLNKIAGAVFGVLKMAIIVGTLLVFLHKANNAMSIVKQETLNNSVLYSPVKQIGEFVFGLVIKKDNGADQET